jgi:hypothetical protein
MLRVSHLSGFNAYLSSTAAAVGALLLLDGETDGFAIDATTYPATVAVINTGDPTDDLSNVALDVSNLVNSGTSPKLVHFPSSPYVRWTPHNMFLNSGTPATQNVTLVTGFVYTVTVTGAGGGNITGSSGASGTATTGSPATFTATGATGTFTLTGSLDTIQLNRGSTATTYLATTGAIRIGIPQGYDETTALYGILVEPAATNLQIRSEEFNTASWTKITSTITANNSTAPDGTTTADLLTLTSANGYINSFPSINTVTANAIHTITVYAKKGNNDWVYYLTADATSSHGFLAYFNLGTGALGGTGTFGTASFVTQSITNVGDGWYRLRITGSHSGTNSYHLIGPTASDGGGFTGANGSTLSLWGAQGELGYAATSYIPTLGSTVTRAADNITVVATSFPLGSSHTAYVSAKTQVVNAQHDVLMLDANNSNEDESVKLYIDSSANILMQIEDGGATQLAPLDSAVNASANTTFQISGAWATNDVDVSANGTAAASDGTATMPTLTHMRLGCNPTPGNHLNGFIYKVVYVPRQVETDGGDIENWRYTA